MNCRSAQRLLSAERDGAPATSERAALGSHLAECAECRRFKAMVTEAADTWRASTAQVPVPDVELAWQAVRREIRSSGPAEGRSAPWLSRWALPIGAAAVLAAVAVVVGPRLQQGTAATGATPTVAMAKSDETPGGGSSVVYVDDKSGWVVVWAVDEQHPKSG